MDRAFALPRAEYEHDNSMLAAIMEFYGSGEEHPTGWRIESATGLSQPLVCAYNNHTPTPEQGWKLHVSAYGVSADRVLRSVLPVLLAEKATFKVIGSVRWLDDLNWGSAGLSQIGKFITVYPQDDAQAIRLAVALDQATQGLPGPPIPSDRPLTPSTLVHYRYGGFSHQAMQTPLGEILPAIRHPSGKLIPDRRMPVYQPPEWVVDPFVAAGVATKLPMQSPLIAKRYLILATLHQSPRSRVDLAVDIVTPRRCILKRSGLGRRMGADGNDTHKRLRHEAEVLVRLAPHSGFPTLFDLIEQEDELFLVIEDFEGETLNKYMARLVGEGRSVPSDHIIAWGRELAILLATIHAKGYIYRDLKSTNVIVAPDGQLHLIDFELAQECSTQVPPYGLGTRGYMSPQQEVGNPVTASDDIYSLGALLYFIATGAEPSLAPNTVALMERPLTLMNPTVRPALAQLIARCLDPNPAERFPSMEALASTLAIIGAEVPTGLAPLCGKETLETGVDSHLRYRLLAHRLGVTLCGEAQWEPNGQGVAWLSTHYVGKGIRSRYLNTGSSGAVLALAEVVSEFGDPEHVTILQKGARWLITAPRPQGEPLPGLYVGEAGIGAALLRAGQALADPELISAAVAKGRWIAKLPHISPDLFHGTAGRARFHLLLWDETADSEHILHAIAAGEALVAAAEEIGDHEVCWTIPSGYEDLSGSAYLGYAHGAAGIADVLLDLFEATGEERFLTTAQGVGRWLARLAVPVLDDESGIDWPTIEGMVPRGAFWCHGATGIGRFFLHAARLEVMEEAADLAARAARAVSQGTRWSGPTQCHGLAGNIEFLVDMAQVTGDRSYLTEAQVLARLLEAFAVEKDGILTWSSESPSTFTPDYMVGYAGIAVCLLRLSNPEHRPHQLSRQGFRYRPRDLNVATSTVN
jgi:hypothetical protein